jgi:hypothetical protein
LRIWVFIYITVDFILGLDILQAYDASVDVGRHVLRLGHDEVPVREPSTASVLKRRGLSRAAGIARQYVGSAVSSAISGES